MAKRPQSASIVRAESDLFGNTMMSTNADRLASSGNTTVFQFEKSRQNTIFSDVMMAGRASSLLPDRQSISCSPSNKHRWKSKAAMSPSNKKSSSAGSAASAGHGTTTTPSKRQVPEWNDNTKIHTNLQQPMAQGSAVRTLRRKKKTEPFVKKNGSICVPQQENRRSYSQTFVGERLGGGPSTSIAPSPTILHVSEFFPAPSRNMTVEVTESKKNRFFATNRKPIDRSRPGTPLWKAAGEVNFAHKQYPVEFCDPPMQQLTATVAPGTQSRPSSALSASRPGTAASRCRALHTAQNTTPRLHQTRPGFVGNGSLRDPVSPTGAPISRPTSAATSVGGGAGTFGAGGSRPSSAIQHYSPYSAASVSMAPPPATDVFADSDSDGAPEEAVRDLEEWTPQETEIQKMASQVLLKYRTSNHKEIGTDGVTMWDYAWEKPVSKDVRVLAEMNRYAGQQVASPTNRRLTSLSLVSPRKSVSGVVSPASSSGLPPPGATLRKHLPLSM